jgi:pyruvate dehydrogenase E1 component alpha subunit
MYGMSMDIARAAAKLPIAQRAEGYGIPWYFIDGNDMLTVYEIMHDAAEFIRSGKGPVLVETQTYRYFGHSKSDRNLYRTKDEIESWRNTKDPIVRFQAELETNGFITTKKAEEINAEIIQLIDAAVAFAESAPEPDPSSVEEYVYA